MLGRVSLSNPDGHDTQSLLGQPRRLALLAYLAASPPGMHRRDSLLALFWPELDQAHARNALRQAIHVLRRALGASAVASHGDEEVGLDFDQVSCDVAAFERAMADGELRNAVELYRGDLLEGFFISDAPEFERWLEVERARLRSAAVGSARTLVERATEDGDAPGAAEWARRGLRVAPLDEGLMQQLIGALDRLGDRAGAVQAYDDFARRLSHELEVRPSAETQALLAAVREREGVRPPRTANRALAPAGSSAAGQRRVPRRVVLALVAGLPAVAIVTLVVALNFSARRRQSEGKVDGPAAPTANREAYNLYLKGKVRMRRESRADDSVASTLFERAVALEPTFAAAQAELGRAYAIRVYQFAPSDSSALERAQVAGEKALRLDPKLAEAHQTQAVLLWGIGGFAHERAIREDRRALALNPNLDRAHQHLGNIYLHIGLLDQSIGELQQTLIITPRDDNAQRRIAEVRAYQGHYAEALAIMRQVPPESNRPLWTYETALVLLHLGKRDDALAVIQEYLRAYPHDQGGVVTSARAVSFALAGDARRAEADIQTAVQKGKGFIHFHHAAYDIALAYALLHRPDSAVYWLRTAADGGLPCYPLFKNDPFLGNIRNDPEFVAFLREQQSQWDRWQATL